jgi:phosphatidylglycerol:prolipoprotein diacylglycerol transferase
MLPNLAAPFFEDPSEASFHVPAYFTLLVIGFAVSTVVAVGWALRSKLDKEVIIDLGLIALLAGIAGGRVLHVVADGHLMDYVHWCTDPTLVDMALTPSECTAAEGVWNRELGYCHPAESDCFAWAKFWNGGLTYYGGLFAALLVGYWFVRREGFPLLKAADVAGLVLPIGLFFGRIGCFLNGCCFGSPTDHVFGVSFPPWSAASHEQWEVGLLDSPAVPSLAVHPTQLYEALGCLAIAAVLIVAVHPKKTFDGQVVLLSLASYAGLRFVLEFWRADDRGGFLSLSTSQLIALAVIAAAVFFWRRWSRRAETAIGAQPTTV